MYSERIIAQKKEENIQEEEHIKELEKEIEKNLKIKAELKKEEQLYKKRLIKLRIENNFLEKVLSQENNNE